MKTLFIHGNFLDAPTPQELRIREDHWLRAENGRIVSLEAAHPDAAALAAAAVRDFGKALLLPPFVDLHLHAPQYNNRGLGLELTLLDWLQQYTFPEESRFASLDYARPVFLALRHELWQVGSLRSVIFASLHTDAALLLMQLLSEAGLAAYVGKVNMDRNSIPELSETTEGSVQETLRFLEGAKAFAPQVRPILTPRFAPSCTPELLRRLGELAAERGLPVQSHLNETPEEVAWVHELFPEAPNYLSVYEHYGLLPQGRTILAHGIYNTPPELALLRKRQVCLVHCPSSNMNIGSGIMAAKKLLRDRYKMGLGSDISGGEDLDLRLLMRDAHKASALQTRLDAATEAPLTTAEVLYLATCAGAQFFNAAPAALPAGIFEPGYSCDLLAINDSALTGLRSYTLAERLARALFQSQYAPVFCRMLGGRELPEPEMELQPGAGESLPDA